ncbi:hypothetical protein [Photobacterium atrarenae]|uniref:Flp pilus-assembly TadG-like N-terminal domain-containing protein n=1 Tax=Photobacterium atrarenae TaxID=865757 RepID=A0ABY5GDC8_9GAMM|nr:hypothetical protein [Photobacterium atrarenae]UTV27197.1 hypothetical protein NNL38_12750 [Photobacterium atrarenae]
MRMSSAGEYGFSTLIITVVIAVLMSLYALSVLSVQVFNLKKAQNVIVAKELKAKANTALQCATEVIVTSKDVGAAHDFSNCNDAAINFTQIGTSKKYKLTSLSRDGSSNGEAVTSVYIMASASSGPTAAFASTGSIVFNVSQTIDPYEGSKNGTGYDCISIRTGGQLQLPNGTDLIVRDPHNQSGQQKKINGKIISCNPSHKTVSPKSRDEYKSDIQEEVKNIDLFSENFGVPRERWAEVVDKFDVRVIGDTLTQEVTIGGLTKTVEFKKVKNCGEKLKQIIDGNRRIDDPNKKQRYLWLEGTCDLAGIGYIQEESADNAVTIVVKDGVLYSSDNVYFHGNLYLFDHSMTDEQLLAAWSDSGLKQFLPNEDFSNIPFYFRGSFITRGAFNLDSPNRVSHVFGSFQPGYSKGKVDYSESPFGGDPVVMRGSWHDF